MADCVEQPLDKTFFSQEFWDGIRPQDSPAVDYEGMSDDEFWQKFRARLPYKKIKNRKAATKYLHELDERLRKPVGGIAVFEAFYNQKEADRRKLEADRMRQNRVDGDDNPRPTDEAQGEEAQGEETRGGEAQGDYVHESVEADEVHGPISAAGSVSPASNDPVEPGCDSPESTDADGNESIKETTRKRARSDTEEPASKRLRLDTELEETENPSPEVDGHSERCVTPIEYDEEEWDYFV